MLLRLEQYGGLAGRKGVPVVLLDASNSPLFAWSDCHAGSLNRLWRLEHRIVTMLLAIHDGDEEVGAGLRMT